MSQVEQDQIREVTVGPGPTRGRAPSRWLRTARGFERAGKWLEAEAEYRKGLRERPGDAELYRGLGKTLTVQKRLEEALAAFDSAAGIEPGNPLDLCNAGAVLQRMGHPGEATDLLIEVVTAHPRFVEARYNLALSLRDLDIVHSAIEQLDAVLALDPSCINAEFERALLKLMSGDYENGWREYECRRRHAGCDISRRSLPGPLWDGQPFPGRTVILFEEQGFGDTFQFCRYVSRVKELGGRVVLECRPATRRLFEGFGCIDELVDRGAPLPSYDMQAPLLSLPWLLETTLAEVPWDGPYLNVDPGTVAHSEHSDDRVRVGIAWAGSPTHPNDTNRSATFEVMAPLLDVPGIEVVSLQKGPQLEELRCHRRGSEVPELGSSFGDFMDTAQAIRGLDVVVTVDTSIAHLAGAMGKPVWILLPYSAEWRWLRKRSDSPWYPTARLFRQREPHDWEDVIARVSDRLRGQA